MNRCLSLTGLHLVGVMVLLTPWNIHAETTDPVDANCTWSTDGSACHPGFPRRLFDVNGILALTLEDLAWQPTDAQTLNGVTVIKGTFSGGRYDAYTADGEAKTIELTCSR